MYKRGIKFLGKDKAYKKNEENTLKENIKLAQEGDRNAYDYLIIKYTKIIMKISNDFFFQDGDSQDVIQVGLEGLYEGIRDFDFKDNWDKSKFENYFIGFIKLCSRRKIISGVLSSKRRKHEPLNESFSINRKISSDDNRGREFGEVIKNPKTNLDPLDKMIDEENLIEYKKFIKKELTELELKCISLRIKGHSYEETARKLNRKVKSVDNALNRAKRKIEDKLFERRLLKKEAK